MTQAGAEGQDLLELVLGGDCGVWTGGGGAQKRKVNLALVGVRGKAFPLGGGWSSIPGLEAGGVPKLF